jgi:hypothetical protein
VIPYLVTARYRRSGGRWWRLYIPVPLVALAASPLLLLAVAGGLVACRVFGISLVGALRGAWQLLWALPGTQLELVDSEMAVQVRVR